VVNGEVREVSGSVMQDKGCIKGEMQHKKEDETGLTQQLIERGSWLQHDSNAVALRRRRWRSSGS
jgi:hypothetical protein